MTNKQPVLFRPPTQQEAAKWVEVQNTLFPLYSGQQQTAKTARQTAVLAAWTAIGTFAGLLYVIPAEPYLIALSFFVLFPLIAWRFFVFAVLEDATIFRCARKLAEIEIVQIQAGIRPKGQKDEANYILERKSAKLNFWHGVLAQMIILDGLLLLMGLTRLSQLSFPLFAYAIFITLWGAVLAFSSFKFPKSRTGYYTNLYGYALVGTQELEAVVKSNTLTNETETHQGKTYYKAVGVLQHAPLFAQEG